MATATMKIVTRPALLAAGLLLLTTVGCVIPRDRDLAAGVEDTIRKKMRPERVEVYLKRPSSFSTKVKTLEIAIDGFNADTLVLGAKKKKPATKAAETTAKPDEKPKEPYQGRLLRIIDTKLTCQNFVASQIPVQSLEMKVHEMRIPLGNAKAGDLVIAAAESATGYIVFNESGLGAYLRAQKLPLKHPTIRIAEDGCVVSGKVDALVDIPVEVSGKIAVRDGAVLYLDQPELRVMSLALPDAITKQVLKDINPLADLNADMKLPAPLAITEVTYAAGTLRFDVALDFPKPE